MRTLFLNMKWLERKLIKAGKLEQGQSVASVQQSGDGELRISVTSTGRSWSNKCSYCGRTDCTPGSHP